MHGIPVYVFGSAAMIVGFLAVDQPHVISSGAVIALALHTVFMVLMLRSYFRFRNRDRPADVSQRRIRKITLSSGAAGVAWALFAGIALPSASSDTAVIVLLITSAYALASLMTITASPIAGLTSALPVLVVNSAFMPYFGHLPFLISCILSGGLLIVCLYCASINWKRTRTNVALRVDNTLAEAARTRSMEQVSARLSKYLSPQLFEEILTGRQTEEITSKRKKLTVFFSDIVGFTEITDSLESEELAALLNRYLTEMTAIAEEHGGTVDKFIGDAVVVYFGDPNTKGTGQDAEACVRMALAMKDRVRELKQEWVDLGLLEGFDLRIGINTGYCNVGNFGSDQRVDYTVVGNEVNLAARLESAAGTGAVLLSGKTYALVKDLVKAEEKQPLSVKGFSRPVSTFQVTSMAQMADKTGTALRISEPNLSLRINPDQMTAHEPDLSAAILKEALDGLARKPPA